MMRCRAPAPSMGYAHPGSAADSPVPPDHDFGPGSAISATRAGSERSPGSPLQQADGDCVLCLGPAICAISRPSSPIAYGRAGDFGLSQSPRYRRTRQRLHPESGSARAALSLSPHTLPRHGAHSGTHSGKARAAVASCSVCERSTLGSFAYARSCPSMREPHVRQRPPFVRVYPTSGEGHRF